MCKVGVGGVKEKGMSEVNGGEKKKRNGGTGQTAVMRDYS